MLPHQRRIIGITHIALKEKTADANFIKMEQMVQYKPGPGLKLDIIMKLKSIFAELCDESLLEKCLHGKTQDNSMIWDRIPKRRYVSLTQLQLRVYDAVANFSK